MWCQILILSTFLQNLFTEAHFQQIFQPRVESQDLDEPCFQQTFYLSFIPPIGFLSYSSKDLNPFLACCVFSVAAILVLTIIIYFLIHIYKRYKNETGSRMTRFTNSLRGSLQGFSGRRPSWFNRRTERTMVQSELSATNGKTPRVLFNCIGTMPYLHIKMGNFTLSFDKLMVHYIL